MSGTEYLLPEWEDPRRILRRYGRQASRAYSQNFLVNRRAALAIAEIATPNDGMTVVELGAGLGHLTWALLQRHANVIALDVDRDMIAILRERFAGCPRLSVVETDATSVNLRRIAPDIDCKQLCVAGNIPYSVTGGIVRNLSEQSDCLNRAVLMVQREVAQRMRAQPGSRDYGLLSVFAQGKFKVERVLSLREGSFFPAPKVRSEVLLLLPLPNPRASCDDDFSTLVKAAFQQRRKTLLNALKTLTDSKELALLIADRAQIDVRLRAEMLSVEDFDRLAKVWKALR